MAYPRKQPFTYKYYSGTIADISTANSSAQIPIVGQGELISVALAIDTAITAADATITVLKNGTAISGTSTFTVTQSGSAEGDFDSLDCTPTPVDWGDVIEVSSDGGSTTASKAHVTLVVREAP